MPARCNKNFNHAIFSDPIYQCDSLLGIKFEQSVNLQDHVRTNKVKCKFCMLVLLTSTLSRDLPVFLTLVLVNLTSFEDQSCKCLK